MTAKIVSRLGIPFRDVHVSGYRGFGVKPKGMVIHHTASPNMREEASLQVVRVGRSGVPGPLSQWYIDRSGELFLITEGLANHAGSGSSLVLSRMVGNQPVGSPGPDNMTGNSDLIGVEIENNGTGEVFGLAAYFAAVTLAAAQCIEYGWNPLTRIIGHKEWTRRKPDPAFDMRKFRADVEGLIPLLEARIRPVTAPVAPPAPAPVPPSEADLLRFFQLAQWKQLIDLRDHLLGTILRKGSTGVEVGVLQKELNDVSPSDINLVVDGDFGQSTEDRVKVLQTWCGLVADGVVGPATWGKLFEL